MAAIVGCGVPLNPEDALANRVAAALGDAEPLNAAEPVVLPLRTLLLLPPPLSEAGTLPLRLGSAEREEEGHHDTPVEAVGTPVKVGKRVVLEEALALPLPLGDAELRSEAEGKEAVAHAEETNESEGCAVDEGGADGNVDELATPLGLDDADKQSDEEGESLAQALRLKPPLGVLLAVTRSDPVPDAHGLPEAEGAPLPEREPEAQALSVYNEALALGVPPSEPLDRPVALGTAVAAEDTLPLLLGAEEVEGCDAEGVPLGGPLDEKTAVAEADRSGERDAEGAELPVAVLESAPLAEGTAVAALLKEATAVALTEGDPVSHTVRVVRASVPLTVSLALPPRACEGVPLGEREPLRLARDAEPQAEAEAAEEAVVEEEGERDARAEVDGRALMVPPVAV